MAGVVAAGITEALIGIGTGIAHAIKKHEEAKRYKKQWKELHGKVPYYYPQPRRRTAPMYMTGPTTYPATKPVSAKRRKAPVSGINAYPQMKAIAAPKPRPRKRKSKKANVSTIMSKVSQGIPISDQEAKKVTSYRMSKRY